MVDDSEDSTTDTIRHLPPAEPEEDEGSADTMMAHTVPPLPPIPPVGITPPGITPAGSIAAAAAGGSLPSTRRLGKPASRDSIRPIATDGSRYAIGSVLGQGGMGEVFLAVDEQIGREVAVKRIRSAHPSDEERARFVREARVQGRLEHPAVVPVHDLAIDQEGKPFFVMKRLSGTEMSELLKQLGSPTRDEPDKAADRRRLLRAFVDVCLAIEFAHSRGIIHRDLKPANIMLGDFGEVYVLDWGVARAVADADDSPAAATVQHDLQLDSGETRVGTVLGTPAYMSPEQMAGERAGPASDIYSLGCILYEIAAGEPLHVRNRSIGAAFLPIDARPSNRRPDSPPELDAICDRATRIELATRFATARALGDAVQAFLDGDRDLAVRKELAHHHLTEARDALARGDAETHRRDAMRAAGRALALDPTAGEAAELVTHLMLKPPHAIPAEVEHHLATLDTDTARSQGRLAALAMLGYLAFVPLLVWTGVRDLLPIAGFTALAILSAVQVYALTRRERITAGGIYLNACINAVLIALVCRMVGPFIIAPTLVTTTLMAYAAHTQFGRLRIVGTILTAAVAIPWLLEAVGVLAPTYEFAGGKLVLSWEIVTFTAAPVQLAFAILLVSLVVVVAVLSRTIATRQRDATRQVELQAWHLRQIVATAAR